MPTPEDASFSKYFVLEIRKALFLRKQLLSLQLLNHFRDIGLVLFVLEENLSRNGGPIPCPEQLSWFFAYVLTPHRFKSVYCENVYHQFYRLTLYDQSRTVDYVAQTLRGA